MDKLLNDLGGIVLNGLPTAIIVLILAVFVRQFYLKPLEAVLAERHRLTEGARQAAEQSLHSADSKIAAYQTALDEARSPHAGGESHLRGDAGSGPTVARRGSGSGARHSRG